MRIAWGLSGVVGGDAVGRLLLLGFVIQVSA